MLVVEIIYGAEPTRAEPLSLWPFALSAEAGPPFNSAVIDVFDPAHNPQPQTCGDRLTNCCGALVEGAFASKYSWYGLSGLQPDQRNAIVSALSFVRPAHRESSSVVSYKDHAVAFSDRCWRAADVDDVQLPSKLSVWLKDPHSGDQRRIVWSDKDVADSQAWTVVRDNFGLAYFNQIAGQHGLTLRNVRQNISEKANEDGRNRSDGTIISFQKINDAPQPVYDPGEQRSPLIPIVFLIAILAAPLLARRMLRGL